MLGLAIHLGAREKILSAQKRELLKKREFLDSFLYRFCESGKAQELARINVGRPAAAQQKILQILTQLCLFSTF